MGADLNTKNFRGRTPLDNALKAGHKEIIDLLMANGAKERSYLNIWPPPPFFSDALVGNHWTVVIVCFQERLMRSRGYKTLLVQKENTVRVFNGRKPVGHN